MGRGCGRQAACRARWRALSRAADADARARATLPACVTLVTLVECGFQKAEGKGRGSGRGGGGGAGEV